MITQFVKTIPVEIAEKTLNGFIQEGCQIISMTTTELGVLVVLQADIIPQEVKPNDEILRGIDLYRSEYTY